MGNKLLLSLAISFLTAVTVMASDPPAFTAFVTESNITLTPPPSVFRMPTEESLKTMSPTALETVTTAAQNNVLELKQRCIAARAFAEELEEIYNVVSSSIQESPLQSYEGGAQPTRLEESSDRLSAITRSDLLSLPTTNVPSTSQSEVGEVTVTRDS